MRLWRWGVYGYHTALEEQQKHHIGSVGAKRVFTLHGCYFRYVGILYHGQAILNANKCR
jgi:hypothetical protein